MLSVGAARQHEILDLTWNEVDRDDGVIRLSPDRSQSHLGRVLPPYRSGQAVDTMLKAAGLTQ